MSGTPSERKRIGLRVEILDIPPGTIWHGLPIKTGRPEHVGKRGTITRIRHSIPLITLDDGNVVPGSECWWVTVEDAERARAIVREEGE